MLHYRRYGFVLPASDSLAGALARVFEVFDEALLEAAPLRFLLDDTPLGTACPRILERFPELEPFAVRTIPRPGFPASLHLSNLDGRWQGGNPKAIGKLSRETLLAVAEGIPSEFPLWIACIVIGPVTWDPRSGSVLRPQEAAVRPAGPGKSQFSGLAPSMTYLAPGVILQRLSTGGLRLWITEQLPDAAPDTPTAPAVRQLLARFGPAQSASRLNVPEHHVASAAPPPVDANLPVIHAGYRERLQEIVGGLPLTFKPPEPGQLAQIPLEPLGKVRSVIAHAFKKDGWRRATERLPAGTHKLWKETPVGRRLELSFDTGSWSRHLVCTMALVTDRGSLRLPVLASPSPRLQYLTPNPQVFAGVLENMRIVVKHLETTWVAALEAAMK